MPNTADYEYDLTKPSILCGSESPNGEPLNLTGCNSSSAAKLLHVSTSEDDEWDEVTVEATNISAGTLTVTAAWGGTDAGVPFTHSVDQSVPSHSTVVLVDRRPIRGGLKVYAFATTTPENINTYTSLYRYKGKPRAAS